MQSKEGSTLGGVGLKKGRIKLGLGAGIITPATTFHCHSDGSLEFTFDDDSKETVAWVAGDAFPVDNCKSMEIKIGGTFSIGFD